jgi:hypothetical protein
MSMGVYISGLEIPPKGKAVAVTLCSSGAVYSGGQKVGIAVTVMPQGDLIYREALMDDIIGSMVFSGRKVQPEAAIVQKVLDIVGDANAIIPAEEGDAE